MSVITLFLFFGSRSHIGSPNTIAFWNIEHFQIEALLWIVNYKMEQMCSLRPTFLVYIHEVWNLGKTYGIELRCCWEPFEQKIPPHQENIWIPWMHVWAFSLVTWNFYFQNCLSTFLTWPIDKGTNYGKDLARLVLISKDLIQFIYTKLGGQNKTKLFPWHHKKEFHSPCVRLLFFVAFHMRFHISILSCNIFSIFIVLVP
jgi:hypothetical protein